MSDSPYNNQIVNQIKDYLDHEDWSYFFDEEEGFFDLGLRIEGALQKLQYIIDVEKTNYAVYAYCPLSADSDNPPQMSAVAEFFTWVNYGMRNGSLELDMTDGEIRCKVFVDCEDRMPSDAIIRNSLAYPSACFDFYGNAIIDLVIGNKSVDEAIARFDNPVLENLSDIDPDDFDAMEEAIRKFLAEQDPDEDGSEDE